MFFFFTIFTRALIRGRLVGRGGSLGRFVISGTNEGRVSCDACTRTNVQDRYIAHENQFSVFFLLLISFFSLLIRNVIEKKNIQNFRHIYLQKLQIYF